MNDDSRGLDERLTAEVAQLLTKLVTAVAKQLELEEKLLVVKRENSRLREHHSATAGIEDRYRDLETRFEAMKMDYDKNKTIKEEAEAENRRLLAEVEDLTASLFDEANKMVSDASRLTDNYKIKNGKLYEELHEKDVIIEDLQAQLQDLKQLFVRIEEEQKAKTRTGTPAMEQTGFDLASQHDEQDKSYKQLLSGPIFAPKIEAVRFDLDQYQYDYKSFVYAIIKPTFVFDLAYLKTLKYFKKIWVEELENSISHVPPLANSTFINRWQKGKNFWSLIVEGRAVIEPIKSVNEAYKVTYRGRTPKDAPVATREPCTFCNESRDDVLEHARLYSLKLHAPELSSTSLAENEPVASYHLCNYCLIKLRNICDFFAKLRSIHSNIFKLKQNSSFEEYTAPLNFQFKRQSDSELDLLKERKEVVLEAEEEAKLRKLYITLTQIRSRIFWSKIGLWDHEGVISESAIDEIPHEAFGQHGTYEEKKEQGPVELKDVKKAEVQKTGETNKGVHSTSGMSSSVHKEPVQRRGYAPEPNGEQAASKAAASAELPKTAPESAERRASETTQVTSSESQENLTITTTASTSVADRVRAADARTKKQLKARGEKNKAADDTPAVDTSTDSVSETSDEKPLSRRLSTKERKQKISNDLNSTIQMLQESIE